MESNRILLRPWREKDAEGLYRLASDPEVGPRAGWQPHRSVGESREVIRTLLSNDHTWVIVRKASGEPIGCICYYLPYESNIGIGPYDAEVGYWVGRPWWNQGIATEALQLLINHCFNEKDFLTLWADYRPDNPANGRVLQKCGFRNTGRQNLISHLAIGSDTAVNVMRLDNPRLSVLTSNKIKDNNMKQYNFDTPIERRGTDCFKWDALPGMYGRDDLLPMWVADNDWAAPDFVLDAMRQRLEHPVLGYTMPSEGYWLAVTAWLAKHYGIHTTKDTLHYIPGIVAGISYALLCLTQPGDRVLVTTPVYPPFLNVPQGCGREVVCSQLKIHSGRFAIDFDDFERKAEGCKVFIMSNPHNPAGTLWGKETLLKIADICERKGLLVISDEIHADLTLPGGRHVSYSTVSPTAARHSITFMAPSKTFNIAGLGSSVCCITDATLRNRFFGWLDALGVAGGNIFAFTAAEAAFAHGEEWQRQMLEYLNANVQTLDQYLKEHLPKVKAVLPEASYLAWLDFSAYGIPHKTLAEHFIQEARVVMNDGTTFGVRDRSGANDGTTFGVRDRSGANDGGGGEAYEGCFRLNIGCPRAQMLDALDRIARVVG